MERVPGREDETPYDKKLELRLGLPGHEQEEHQTWSKSYTNNISKEKPVMGYLPCVTHSNSCDQKQPQGYTTAATTAAAEPWGYAKESSQRCYSSENPAVLPSASQKRSAPPPVVGWPPIRSFRRNLASSGAAKPALNPPTTDADNKKKKQTEKNNKGLFVKINMDGVPIGRKVDLNAYDSYEKLSSAVDILFRGLLAAQKDSSACGVDNKREEEKAITGLLDGSGEYTLVYEDSEGDRMLAGDVPWHMFVSTVKRLRVLKSSDLSSLSGAESKDRKVSSAC